MIDVIEYIKNCAILKYDKDDECFDVAFEELRRICPDNLRDMANISVIDAQSKGNKSTKDFFAKRMDTYHILMANNTFYISMLVSRISVDFASYMSTLLDSNASLFDNYASMISKEHNCSMDTANKSIVLMMIYYSMSVKTASSNDVGDSKNDVNTANVIFDGMYKHAKNFWSTDTRFFRIIVYYSCMLAIIGRISAGNKNMIEFYHKSKVRIELLLSMVKNIAEMKFRTQEEADETDHILEEITSPYKDMISVALGSEMAIAAIIITITIDLLCEEEFKELCDTRFKNVQEFIDKHKKSIFRGLNKNLSSDWREWFVIGGRND